MEGVVAGGHGEGAAGDRQGAVGVHGVIFGINAEGAAGDRQVLRRLDALPGLRCGGGAGASPAAGAAPHPAGVGHGGAAAAGGNGEISAGNQDVPGGVQPVVPGPDLKGSAQNVDVSQCGVIVVFRVEAVGAAFDEEAAGLNAEAILAGHALLGGGDAVGAAGDLQIVLADDAVAGLAGDRQTAAAVDRQIVLGKDHAVDIVLVKDGKAAAV